MLFRSEWKQIVGNELFGKKIGVVGCGNIGKRVLELASAFNCLPFYFDTNEDILVDSKYTRLQTLEELFSSCEIISIHLPLNSTTRNLVDHNLLNYLTEKSIIINLSRGGIINENDLYDILFNKKILGAAIDVFETEPSVNNRFNLLKNVIVTPHIGGSSIESIEKMGQACIHNLKNKII